MSKTAEPRPLATISQQSTPDVGLETRFEAWDCECTAVRTWMLGRPNQVVSLVRLLDREHEQMGFATPMEVTIGPSSLYQPAPSWGERFREMYQVAVYPNMNPDWGEIKAEVATVEEALDVAEAVCADLEADHDLLEAEADRMESVAVSTRGPKPRF